MLQRGDATLCARSAAWLHKSFDCSIAPLLIAPADLLRLAVKWLESDRSSTLELLFDAPPAIANAGLEQLSVSVPVQALYRAYVLRRLRSRRGRADACEKTTTLTKIRHLF